jgi:NAD dependent epimerase/dehydratase family enzyme
MIGDGNFYLNYIHIDDAADAIIYGLKHFEALKGKTVNVTDYKPVLYADVLKSLYQVTGKKKPFYLPMFLARLLLGKNNFSFITNSHRIKKDACFEDWQPRPTDYITNMFQILKKKNCRVIKHDINS